jgi:hypothetical protein
MLTWHVTERRRATCWVYREKESVLCYVQVLTERTTEILCTNTLCNCILTPFIDWINEISPPYFNLLITQRAVRDWAWRNISLNFWEVKNAYITNAVAHLQIDCINWYSISFTLYTKLLCCELLKKNLWYSVILDAVLWALYLVVYTVFQKSRKR